MWWDAHVLKLQLILLHIAIMRLFQERHQKEIKGASLRRFKALDLTRLPFFLASHLDLLVMEVVLYIMMKNIHTDDRDKVREKLSLIKIPSVNWKTFLIWRILWWEFSAGGLGKNDPHCKGSGGFIALTKFDLFLLQMIVLLDFFQGLGMRYFPLGNWSIEQFYLFTQS